LAESIWHTGISSGWESKERSRILSPKSSTARCLWELRTEPPIQRLGIPGMGTGIGGMDPDQSAQQMVRAYIEVMKTCKSGSRTVR
jgi:O-acetyl-ADP-ribose deacetylase (regulator of RNase III)